MLQIAVEKFSEATVGYRENREIAEKWVQLFSTPYFMVSSVSEIHFILIIAIHLLTELSNGILSLHQYGTSNKTSGSPFLMPD